MSKIKAHHLRELQAELNKGNITESRMIEILNEIAAEMESRQKVMEMFKARYAVAQDRGVLLNLHLDTFKAIEDTEKLYPIGSPERKGGIVVVQYLRFIQDLCQRRLLEEAERSPADKTPKRVLFSNAQANETMQWIGRSDAQPELAPEANTNDRYALFHYLSQNFGVIATDDQLWDIIEIALESDIDLARQAARIIDARDKKRELQKMEEQLNGKENA